MDRTLFRNIPLILTDLVSISLILLLTTHVCCYGAHVQTSVDQKRETQDKEESEQCSGGGNTFYIHEYHTYGGENDVSGAKTHGGTVRRFPASSSTVPDSFTSDIYNQSTYLREKSDWLQTYADIQRELATERTRRLDMVARLVAWVRTGPEADSLSRKAGSGHVAKLLDMVALWSTSGDCNYTGLGELLNLTKEERLISQKDPTQGEDVSSCEVCNSSLSSAVEEMLAKNIEDIHNLQKETKRLQRRYLTTYSGYKRVLALTRELRRDLRSWEHRAGRLLTAYGRTRPHDDGESTRNISETIETLNRRIWCLEQESPDSDLCPNVKPRRPESSFMGASSSAIPITKDDTARAPAMTWGPALVTPPGGEEILTGNDTAVTTDTIVQAGIQVSHWYLDQLRQQRPKDCSEIDYWTQRRDPVQTIHLEGRTRPVTVLCQEGWIVVMRNNPYGTSPVTLDKGTVRSWNDYKFGFGRFDTDQFWIGNEYLHQITNQDDYQLIIEMIQSYDEAKVYTEYAFFKITSEKDGYRLQVGDNRGTAGDVLGVHSQTPLDRLRFSTVDMHAEVLENTVQYYREGWWYPDDDIELDPGGQPVPCFTHLTYKYPWTCGSNGYQQLSLVVMKIKPLSDSIV